MQFNCGRERLDGVVDRAKHWWHPWFAWFPVRVGKNDCRWLEIVWRKGIKSTHWDYDGGSTNWVWEYKV